MTMHLIEQIIIIIMTLFQQRILIALTLLFVVNTTRWTELSLIRTGTFKPISGLTSPTTNVTTFPVTFAPALGAAPVIYWGLGLVGYQTYLASTFSFNTTVDSMSSTSISVTVQPQDTTYLVYIRLCFIITGLSPTAVPRMELKNSCFKCLNISQNVNTSKPISPRSQEFNQTSSMAYSTSVQVRSFLFGFNLSNTDGQVNYLQVDTTFFNTTNLTYTHKITTKEYNNINYVCITIIAWNSIDNAVGKGNAAFLLTYLLDPVNKTSQIPYYASLDYNHVFFMGLSSICHQMGGERLLGVHPETYSKISSSFDYNSNFTSATLTIFYVGYLSCAPLIYVNATMNCDTSCVAPYNANVSNNCEPCNPICFTCSYNDPNVCTSCISVTNRNGSVCNCSGLYFTNSSDRTVGCLLCSDFMLYCTRCERYDFCLACQSGKFLVNGTCKCQNTNASTYLVNGVCLTYAGCLAAYNITNSNYCSKCNTAANFQFADASNLTCVCVSGYSNSNNSQICTPICGDGVVNKQACDDGNKKDDDGCANCTVVDGWYCYVTYVTAGTPGPSNCTRISNASISYLYAERVPGSNTALLYFKFSPSGTVMPSSAFQGGISTSAPISTIASTYSSANSRITLTVAFTSSLEANTYNFTFNFTSALVYYSAPVTIQVKTVGVNEQLLIESFGVLVKTIQYVVMGLSFLALGLGVVSSVVGYKLMGLELLLPLQTAFFTQFGMVNPPPYVSSLKSLKYSMGYNQLIPYNYEEYYNSTSKFAKFDYQVEMALNLNVMAVVLMLGTLVLLILQVIYLVHYANAAREQQAAPPPPVQNKKNVKGKKEEKAIFEVKEEGERGLSLKNARENRNGYVNNFYFFLSASICQEAWFCFIIQNAQVSVHDFYLSQDLNLMTGYLVILLVTGNLIFMISQLGEKKDLRIINFQQTRVIKYPMFLIYSTLSISLVVCLTFTFAVSAWISALMSLLPLIGLVYFRPYRHEQTNLNAFTAFLNLSFPLIASSVYLVNNLLALPEMGWLLSVVVIMVWLIASQTSTIIRMVKIIPWRDLPLLEKCLKKKKKDEGALLDKSKIEIEMSSMVKNSIKGDATKIVDWEDKNKKDYESISHKPENDDEADGSDHYDEEDELAQLKKRLKKEIMTKKAI